MMKLNLWLIMLSFVVVAVFYSVPADAGKPSGGICTKVPGYQYEGSAYALNADLQVALLHFDVGPLSDTGELPATGGMLDKQFLSLSNPAPLKIDAGILNAATVGSGNLAVSWASVVGLDVNLADLLRIRAGVLQATAKQKGTGKCPSMSISDGGSGSNIVDLVIDGGG